MPSMPSPYGSYGPGGPTPFSSSYAPGSPMGQWDWQNFTEGADQWATQQHWGSMGFDPSNPFGQTYMNPYTQQTFAMSPFDMAEGRQLQNKLDYQTYEADPFSDFLQPGGYRNVMIGGQQFMGLDPSHNLTVNPGALAGAFGGGGGGGVFNPGEAPAWDYTAPPEWSQYEFELGSIDPTAAIESYQPIIQERRDKAFAQMNADMAPVMRGMTAGTPYAKAAMGVERHAQEDYDRIAQEYMFKAASENARNDLQRQITEANLYNQMMAQSAAQQHAAQLAMNAHNLGGYGTEGQLGLGAAQLDQSYQAMMAQYMMQMMGMFGPG